MKCDICGNELMEGMKPVQLRIMTEELKRFGESYQEKSEKLRRCIKGHAKCVEKMVVELSSEIEKRSKI